MAACTRANRFYLLPSLFYFLSSIFSLLSSLFSLLSSLYSLLSTLYSLLSTLYYLLSTLYEVICLAPGIGRQYLRSKTLVIQVRQQKKHDERGTAVQAASRERRNERGCGRRGCRQREAQRERMHAHMLEVCEASEIILV